MTESRLATIVTNARIPTGDPGRPWATALAVRDGMLAVVGSAAEILKMAGADTRIIDAGRQLVDLPDGSVLGSPITVNVATDGRVTICTLEDRS